ncbi:MAG TPA: hypothetical protein VGD50_06365 [Candidatus Baltobacteraceae bacterium]
MVRLIWYAIVVGLASAFAEHEWTRRGLDGVGEIDTARAQAPFYIGAATLGLAIFSRLWRTGATLLLGVLVGAVITAPFAVARVLNP